jgi:DNA processing protein
VAERAQVCSNIAVKYLRLHLADAVGPVLLGRLIRRFDTIDAVLSASMAELCEVEGIGERRSRSIFESRSADAALGEIEKAAEAGIRIICWEDAEYPPQLRHCDDPPICLYVRGRLEPEDAVAVAIVGSRHCSHYGLEQSRRFASLLAGAGFTVVSGLARGIDGHAHEGALAAGGRTVAVLGSGVDLIYPPEHAELAERVMENGAVLSEDPIGSAPTTDSFPRRNRIIAGMTLGTIVVEASHRSGALITARLATEYNREVFAVPGRVDATTSLGTNDMIRRGAAKLVARLEDVIEELGDAGRIMTASAGSSDRPKTRRGDADELSATGAPAEEAVAVSTVTRAALTADEQAIVACLGEEDRHVDHITVETGLAAAQVAAGLTTLQIKGLVVALPGGRYALRRT